MFFYIGYKLEVGIKMRIDKTLIIIFIITLVTVIGMVSLLDVFNKDKENRNINYESEMNQVCQDLGLELLDYSKSTIFKYKKLSCFNKTTKEVITIK